MGLKGILTPRGVISGSWQTFNGNYNKLTNKPTLNGVTIEGDKTSEDYHIETGGGGGGTTDYNDLENKPQINDVTLSGNKSLDALGIQAKIGFPQDNSKYLDGEGNFTTPPSGSTYSETELWSGSGYIDSIWNLSESYKNFDAIAVYVRGGTGDNYITSHIIPVSILDVVQSNSNFRYGITTDGWYSWFYVRSNTQFERADTSQIYVNAIIGIKYH